MPHSNTHPVRKRPPLTAWSTSLRCVSAAEHQTAEQYSKTSRKKLQKPLPRSYLSWTHARTSSRFHVLRSCSGNRANLLLKGHLGIKCYSQYIKVIRILQHSSANSYWGWQGWHSLGLTRIQFHSPKVSPLTYPSEVMDQGLCYCTSNSYWWHSNGHESWVFSITDQIIFQKGKKAPKCTGGTTIGSKTLHAALLTQH